MALRDDLHSWLTDQPAWQQDLSKRLCGGPLPDEEFEDALRVVKAAHGGLAGGETAPELVALELEDLPASATKGAPRLERFGKLRGVGAVSDDHQLQFARNGLTVIYGKNAAGKTTYVRALKRVCRAVDAEGPLHGNVFQAPDDDAPDPTANVEVHVNGTQFAQRLNLREPADLGLDAISVFDSECAELYVDQSNTVAFVPASLLVLTRLAATQDRMRGALEAEVGELETQKPVFPELPPETTAGQFVAAISKRTTVDEVRELATLDENEHEQLLGLRAVLASAAASTAAADAQSARQDCRLGHELAQKLRSLGELTAGAARATTSEDARRARESNEAVELATQEFAGLPLAGVGGGPWRQLWQAARGFAEAAGSGFPPSQGQPCPLCLQETSADAAARMAHFEEHIQSAVQANAQTANATLVAALKSLDAARVQECRTAFLDGLAEREPTLHADMEAQLDALDAAMGRLREDPERAEVAPPADDAVRRLEQWADGREAHAEALLAADSPEEQARLKAELAELDAREKLGSRLTDVETWIATAKRIAALGSARSALATNRITTKQRELSEDVVAGALKQQLREELEHLACTTIPVDPFPLTRTGETQVELRLAGAHGVAKVSDIASEGEQRALSLAFFLAEVALSEGDGGIIVDDPVSSLDDERREYIADRLVAEAETRQVVVFTHDLPFMLDLLDRAEKAGQEPLVQGIWRMGSDVGRVDDHPPFKAMRLKKRLGVLAEEVAVWEKQMPPRDEDEAWRRVCDFYARLRISWERAVEELLFKGVVARFQREVKTQWLDDVNITPELVAAVKEGMTRCSKFVHDEPPAAGSTLPGRTELAKDLQKLTDFAAAAKKK
jgi:energy-coupling factor transporter ATP-binding protein EcfA2